MSIQKRPGRPKPWRARLRTPDGRWVTRSFATKGDAQQWERDQLSEMGRGEWVNPRSGRITWDDWAPRVLAARQHLAPKTREDDASGVKRADPYLSGLRLSAITRTTIRQMVSGLTERDLSPWTIRSTHKTVRMILEHAVEDRRIIVNPATGVELPRAESRKAMRLLTPDEVEHLAATIGAVRYGPTKDGVRPVVAADPPDGRYRSLVLLAAYTGMRIGELAGLRVEDLQLLRRRLTVTRTTVEVGGRMTEGRGKTKAARRTINLPSFICEDIAAHLATHGSGPDGEVFTSPTGLPLRISVWRNRVWTPAIEASIGGTCVPHDLRHTHASWLIADNVHPKAIQARLGHTSIKTTLDTYGHLMDGLDEAVAEQLEERRVTHM